MSIIEGVSGLFSLLLAVATSFLGTLILIPFLVRLDKNQHLFARPNFRSSHTFAISNIGGVGVFISVLFGLIPSIIASFNQETAFLMVAFVLLFIIGVKDDMFESGPYFKLVAQLIVALVIVWGAGVHFKSLYGLFGIYNLPPTESIILTVLFILTVINSFNFIDGIDGLAACLGIIGLVISGVFSYAQGPGSMV